MEVADNKMVPQENIQREITDYLASSTEGSTQGQSNEGSSSRRSFLLKSAGVLGGLAVGLYVAPGINSVSISRVNATVSPCPTSATTSDPSAGGKPTSDTGDGFMATSSPCSSDSFLP